MEGYPSNEQPIKSVQKKNIALVARTKVSNLLENTTENIQERFEEEDDLVNSLGEN